MRALIERALWQGKWDQSATARTREQARDASSLVAEKNAGARSRGERVTAHDLSNRRHDDFGRRVMRQDRRRARAFVELTISSRIFSRTRVEAMFRPEMAQD
jgi:hypothetical protein